MTSSPRVLSVTDPAAVSEAATALRNGFVVIAPTETVYAVIVDATNPQSVARMAAAKTRDPKKPTSVFLPDIEALFNMTRLSARAERIARQFLPGPLTLVVPIRDPSRFAAGIVNAEGELGIRLSTSPFIQALTKAIGVPMTATSANRSGEPPCYALSDLPEDVQQGAALLIDAGRLPDGPVSTVLRVRGESDVDLTVLREGAIPAADLLKV